MADPVPLTGILESIPEAVAAAVRRSGGRVALQIKEAGEYRRYTYEELDRLVTTLSSSLSSLGFCPGQRAAILLENRPEWVIAYFGILSSGGTAVPLDIQLTSQEIQSLLARSGSRFLFVSSRTRPLIGTASLTDVTIVTVDQPEAWALRSLQELLREEGGAGTGGKAVTVHPDDIAALLYTSGTTGEPKGVLLSHWNLVSNARGLIMSGLAGPDDHFVALLPLHHAYPFMVSCLVPLLLGAEITFAPTLKGPELLECLREARITFFVAVPQVYAMIRRALGEEISRRPALTRAFVRLLLPCSGWLRHHLRINPGRTFFAPVHRRFGPSLRIMTCGGARLDPEAAEEFHRFGFTLLEGYGLTETAPVITFNPGRKPKFGSVGLPIPGVEVRIANPDEQGIGEVTVRGPNVMLGYDGNPEATAASFIDGWFRSGDLGYLDGEGYLHLTGRAKELIVTAGGKKIVPEELETLYEASPLIAEICLVGAVRPGEGEGLYAVVVPDLNYVKAEKILDVRQEVKSELARIGWSLPVYKRISGLSILSSPLPRTRLGKIKRYQVAALVESMGRGMAQPGSLSEADRRLLETEAGVHVSKALRPFLEKGRVLSPEDHLDLDLGFDSLRRLELLSALEQWYGHLPESLIRNVMTVRDLIEQVSGQSPGGAVMDAGGKSWRDLLKADPPPDIRERLLRPPAPLFRLMLSFARRLVRLLFRVAFRLRVTGIEQFPVTGPFLLAVNHASYLDPFLLLVAVPDEVSGRVHFIGWEPYFRSRVSRWISRLGRVILIGAEASFVTALQAAALVERRGGVLGIFPEGQRSIDGNPLPFQPGIGILACELGVPVVPAWIEGTYQAWPVGRTLPRFSPVSLVVGPPVLVTPELIQRWQQEGSPVYEAATQMVRDAVLALAPPSPSIPPDT
ncbi:AMP-binding protein [Nitrospira sp. NS4]|uniref:AMP-binding protein n=1 Tax=Nitrospira sp. NS4 TaxID=3414498 RepID=UPI003C2FF993